MKRRRIQAGAGILALILAAAPALTCRNVQAATGIVTDQSCSVDFQTGGDFAELKTLEIPVDLYKVAEVEESGAYLPLDGFQDLGLDRIDSQTTAREWEEMAALAAKLAEEQKIEPVETVLLKDGAGTAEDLETGMYLVEARQVQSPEYTYRFTPYLLALPGNEYSSSGNDDWIYDVETGLKPEQDLRYGSIQINKTLDVYNATLGGASFIFSVEAVKDKETVYSDVVSLVFEGPGTKSIEIGNIPAGAQVTVTEVYSGASYELTTPQSQTITVAAESGAAVSFANTYNEENNGGSSIVNHFAFTAVENEAGSDVEDAAQAARREGTWSWTQQTDSTDVQE